MSLAGTRMALDYSILINLFIKAGLNIFSPPLLSTVFVQGCSMVFRKGSLGGTRKAYICVR